ncbi:RES domain-containing protein [Sphingomonas koreensis]|nr:RES domain-containing protein [Sphingomonas koreensis]
MTSAPRSESVPTAKDFPKYAGRVWRLVEAQHRISTNRLAANAEDQALLESLVEEMKPSLPRAARGLHYLLATPFRYGHSRASRFRRAGERPGVFYASEHVATAVAETAYWRLLFFSRSPGLSPPTSNSEHSAFSAEIAIDRLIDLAAPPLSDSAVLWADPDDYAACQDFASEARAIGSQAIRYASVRDPERRANVALFDPAAFQSAEPRIEQTWHFRYEAGRITAFAAFPSVDRLTFSFEQFGLTPP